MPTRRHDGHEQPVVGGAAEQVEGYAHHAERDEEHDAGAVGEAVSEVAGEHGGRAAGNALGGGEQAELRSGEAHVVFYGGHDDGVEAGVVDVLYGVSQDDGDGKLISAPPDFGRYCCSFHADWRVPSTESRRAGVL